MHIIGKINRDIYKCITDDIVTDEVIITENKFYTLSRDIRITMSCTQDIWVRSFLTQII